MADDKGKNVADETAGAEDEDGEEEIRLRPRKAPIAPLVLKPAELLKSAGNETHQPTFENDVWYEQVTVGEVTYRHKLLALRKLSSELLAKKAFEAQPCTEPLRLRDQGNGPAVALVFTANSTVFYHLMVGSKKEMAQAKRLVIFFAKSLLPKTAKQLQEAPSASCAA